LIDGANATPTKSNITQTANPFLIIAFLYISIE